MARHAAPQAGSARAVASTSETQNLRLRHEVTRLEEQLQGVGGAHAQTTQRLRNAQLALADAQQRADKSERQCADLQALAEELRSERGSAEAVHGEKLAQLRLLEAERERSLADGDQGERRLR